MVSLADILPVIYSEADAQDQSLAAFVAVADDMQSTLIAAAQELAGVALAAFTPSPFIMEVANDHGNPFPFMTPSRFKDKVESLSVIYHRRGTKQGIISACYYLSGVKPTLVEEFEWGWTLSDLDGLTIPTRIKTTGGTGLPKYVYTGVAQATNDIVHLEMTFKNKGLTNVFVGANCGPGCLQAPINGSICAPGATLHYIFDYTMIDTPRNIQMYFQTANVGDALDVSASAPFITKNGVSQLVKPDFASAGWASNLGSLPVLAPDNSVENNNTILGINTRLANGDAPLFWVKIAASVPQAVQDELAVIINFMKPAAVQWRFVKVVGVVPMGALESAIIANENLTVIGWAASKLAGAPVAWVDIQLDGLSIGHADLDEVTIRNDVQVIMAAAGSVKDCTKSQFSFVIPIGSVPQGAHVVSAVATQLDGQVAVVGIQNINI